MKKLLLALVAGVLLAPSVASAQFVSFRIPLPPVPPLVVVTPGVQVVEDHDDEIFFHDNHYWVRRDGRWYRSRDPHGDFAWVDHRHVPAPLMGLPPPGHYRHWRHDRREERREDRHEWRDERREDRHERREDRRDDRHDWREERRDDRHDRHDDRHDRREERRDDRREVHQATPAANYGQPVHQAAPATTDQKNKKKKDEEHHRR